MKTLIGPKKIGILLLGILSIGGGAGFSLVAHAQAIDASIGGIGAINGGVVGVPGVADASAVIAPIGAEVARGVNLNQSASAQAQEQLRDMSRSAEEKAQSNGKPADGLPDVQSQFRRFVQESSGRALPIFGSELFNNPAFSPDANLPAPADYVLGVGDQVHVQIWGGVDYTGSHSIDRNGQISIPQLGPVNLAGVPVSSLESVLRTHVSRIFTNFDLTATLGSMRSIQIYVVGQARRPGAHQITSMSTLVNAVFASGGPTATGTMRNIQLKRAGRTVATLDMYEFIARGSKSGDVPLQAGDVIVIPPVGSLIAVTGTFDRPAIYELKPGNSVGDILSLGGGVPVLATTRKALLERVFSGQNPPRRVQDIALDTAGLATTLQDGDILTILGISPAFGNAVTLQGEVAAPLRYPWFEGMRILDLILERDALVSSDYYRRKNLLVQSVEDSKSAGSRVADRAHGMIEQINWEYAVIERLDRSKLSIDLIPFNLGKAVIQRDPANNIVLQPGDVVTVFSSRDMDLPQMRTTRIVRVEGEVNAPGIYQVRPGETLAQLVRRVGVTPQAYLYGAEFTRKSVRDYQQKNLDSLVRRLESQLQ